jgi:hypothetical protein
MARLRAQLSDLYPTGAQLRTLQRRVNGWRAQWARQLVFAATAAHQINAGSSTVNHNPKATTTIGEVQSE